jgi:hypothetical protein
MSPHPFLRSVVTGPSTGPEVVTERKDVVKAEAGEGEEVGRVRFPQ